MTDNGFWNKWNELRKELSHDDREHGNVDWSEGKEWNDE